MAARSQDVQDLPEAEREAIHRFAQVSMVGASTRIENAVLTDAEVDWIETQLSQNDRPTDFLTKQDTIENKLSKDRERSIEEVAGCRNTLVLIYEQARDLFPLTESTIRGLHEELLQFYSPARHYLGRYKTVTNSVIERNAKTGVGRVVFKTADPGPLTEAAMRDLVTWYNNALPENPWSVAVAAEFVFRFLAIHPFQDGNGRLGRGLFLLALLQSPDQNVAGLARYLAIDRQIERHRQEYYTVLQRCSGGLYHQDPTQYRIDYFLKFMSKTLSLSLDDITVYRKTYAAIRDLSPAATAVLECLKEFPELKLQTNDIIETTGLPRRTIINGLNTLVAATLIQKYGKGPATRYQIIF